jgi:2-polyprenyl-6-methoxyphenol hydroxylase-like FAD-dependent oxidoreductase
MRAAEDEDGRAAEPLDVLIVGAGPTGLALAAQLRAFGLRFRIIDRLVDRGRESRALGVQARTLELLQGLGLGEPLVAAGSTSTRLMLHIEGREARAELGGFAAEDTRFPFILFVSQAETERILNEHLAEGGVQVERGVELVDFNADDHRSVTCTIRHPDARTELVRTAYLAGCDGAHSAVRKGAEIPFEGGAYLQDFLLGDLEASGPIEPDTIHSFAGPGGVAMFFPLGSPRSWRVIAMAPEGARDDLSDAPLTDALSLAELQSVVDGATGGTVRLSDPAWLTHFRLHHRQAARYRAGRIFLVGDAAHIHSPVGAQGMNTGIQDAWNLGWKLAFTVLGWADDRLLDSYEAERWPVGRTLLRTTDRVFTLFTRGISAGAVAAWLRREVVSRVLPRVLRSTRLRSFAFGFVSELRIRYRNSPVVTEGIPGLDSGPMAGDRLPDAHLTQAGKPTFLQQELSGPALHLLLCGDVDRWDREDLDSLVARWRPLLATHTLARRDGQDGVLVDPSGEALEHLGVDDAAQFLVRPDGHIAYRCAGRDLRGIGEYLATHFAHQRSTGAGERGVLLL